MFLQHVNLCSSCVGDLFKLSRARCLWDAIRTRDLCRIRLWAMALQPFVKALSRQVQEQKHKAVHFDALSQEPRTAL